MALDRGTVQDRSTFDDWPEQEPEQLALFLSLDGYEGAIDVLLSLARQQKVDLTRISILELAEQYLAFIDDVRSLNLEIAADYLVMAAWLAYLKSRLLLPAGEAEDGEPLPEVLAETLRQQLRRLDAMRKAGRALIERPRLGIDVHARGMIESIDDKRQIRNEASLFDLMRAYADIHARHDQATLRIAPSELYTVEAAMDRLRNMFGHMPAWRALVSFLPAGLRAGLMTRSALASTLVASLELVREGELELLQNDPFGPIYARSRDADP